MASLNPLELSLNGLEFEEDPRVVFLGEGGDGSMDGWMDGERY